MPFVINMIRKGQYRENVVDDDRYLDIRRLKSNNLQEAMGLQNQNKDTAVGDFFLVHFGRKRHIIILLASLKIQQ